MAYKKKIVLFEEEWTDNFYMKLESDHDSAASGLQVSSIGITETLSFGSPFLVLYMEDAYGDLINHTYISPDASYDLYIGVDKNNNSMSSFSMSVNSMENASIGKPQNIAIDLTFMNSKWDKFIRDTYSRSWKEKSYGDVVKEIATENGFITDDIEDTTGKFDVIQPNWSNLKFIKWMSKQAVNADGNSGYDFGLTLDNRLIFASLDKLYSGKAVKALILSDPTNDTDVLFGSITIKQNYAPMIMQGAGGLKYTYFDYDTKTYVTDTKDITDSNSRQLSDWAFIAEEHSTSTKMFDGGRDTNTPNVAATKVANTSNSIQKITITTKGDIDLHIGDTVNIVIPSSEFSKTLVNEKYSGYWLVGEVLHNIDFTNKMFESNLTLIRAGINGTELKGLVKTSKGKVVG